MEYSELLEINPYSLKSDEKDLLLTERLQRLTQKHNNGCKEYSNIIKEISYNPEKVNSIVDLPFLPVRLFKDLSLKSVPDDEIVKTMTSSGTTGQKVSKIFLDRETASNQQKTMVKIVSSFTGSERMPMIIIDCPSVIKDRNMFSARGAGILGFSIFGSKKIYALDDGMNLDIDGLRDFLEKYKNRKILLFGFTFMIWQYFYKELARLKDEGVTFDLSNAILIHGGGWKKLISEAVSEDEFHNRLHDVCGLSAIHDYYGMVEQTGCIYMECECGHLHASIFSDVITRRPKDFSVCNIGEKGIIQVVSAIPESYPGHSLLTEDEGVVLGVDDCPCGRLGKYFKITGRIKSAEIRGCSDTFASDKSIQSDRTDKVEYLIGSKEIIDAMPAQKAFQPFSDEIVSFVNDISSELMRDLDARGFADVVTLGFWLRKSSVNGMRMKFCDDKATYLGRGVAFHIAPSNVPVNFAYSLFTGLLCGNSNIVRVPTKAFPQVGIIVKAINNALERYPVFKKYIALVRYERDKNINDYFSDKADIRIIWGGDNTIKEIRKSEIGPRCTEITFADRYSLAVIDSDYYMKSVSGDVENHKAASMAMDFYNDTYLSDQNACTSPRVVVWTGNKKEEAKSIFWEELYKVASDKYTFQTIQGVDKMTILYEAAALYNGDISCISTPDNLLLRASVSVLKPELMDFRGNSGMFYEYDTDDITSLFEFCNNTHCQTVGYIGESEMIKPLLEMGIKGVDRVVNIGHTMDFELMWDGYNLFDSLTRAVKI